MQRIKDDTLSSIKLAFLLKSVLNIAKLFFKVKSKGFTLD